MKNLISYFVIGLFLIGCNSTKTSTDKENLVLITQSNRPNNPVPPNTGRRSDIEYKIIITDVGFINYLAKIRTNDKLPQFYYESQNLAYVKKWNSTHSSNTIEYYHHINYGFDVNYKLYNYFRYLEYKQSQESNLNKP
jgi:hypothetical protein